MKLKVAFVLALAASVASAAEFHGEIVDSKCKTKDLASHTRKCVLSCADSGLLLVTSHGEFYKLDESGTAKAVEALKASTKEKGLKARVTGTLTDGVLHVETLNLD